ncbi:hypothetical protein [Chitinimonas sp.]|uniref:phage tail terminator protein n=1 Tax=Chitinimonas sp. TaxID=1934313 RepID=UPI0035ADEAB4
MARLAGIPGIKDVHPTANLDDLFEQGKPLPALFVAYRGYTPLQGDGHVAMAGAMQHIDTHWAVVLAARNVRDVQTGAAARQDAQPLLDAIIKRCMGWKASKAHGELYLDPAGEVQFLAGKIAIPLGFRCRQTLSGALNP